MTGKTYTTYALINLYGGGPEYEHEVRLSDYLKTHPDTAPDLKQTMWDGQVQIGMTQEQVVVSWGTPASMHSTISRWGKSEQWIYGDPLYEAQYLYFDDGKLTSMQTSR